jgi:hypothetical protein
VYDKNGLVVGLEFPLFFIVEIEPEKPNFDNMTDEEMLSYKEKDVRYETFILSSFDGMTTDF